MDTSESLKAQFFSSVIADILKAISGGSYYGALTLSFCCIDYMGLAMNPDKKNTSNEFKLYVKDYLSKFNSKYDKYADCLYAVRCSLVHSYGPSDATNKLDINPFMMITDEDKMFHLDYEIRKPQNRFFIIISTLIGDLIASIVLFFHENKNNDDKLVKWYRKLYYYTNSSLISKATINNQIDYSVFHPFLSVINDNSIKYLDISKTIKELIEETVK
jgi:hypothetical protein